MEQLYQTRLSRYLTAMRNEKPDMVPIRPFVAEFTAKYAVDGAEIHGRCEHPIVSGTGDFEGATGRVESRRSLCRISCERSARLAASPFSFNCL